MKYSFVVAVYDVASYLKEGLVSVLRQTYANWECICVDDGSTDGSGLILDTFARQDARFRIVHKPNGGVASARNVGLRLFTGDAVWFVDGDDGVRADALTRVNAEADRLRFGKIILFSAVNSESFPTEQRWLERGEAGTVMSACWCKVFPRNSVERLRFASYPMAEDVLFSLQGYSQSEGMAMIDAALYFYRRTPGSAVTRRFDRGRALAYLYAWRNIVSVMDDSSLWCVAEFANRVRRALFIDATLFFGASGIWHNKNVFAEWIALLKIVQARMGVSAVFRLLTFLSSVLRTPVLFDFGLRRLLLWRGRRQG